MNHFFLLKQYLKYCLKANSAHGIHSPFVYDFITQILQDQRHFYAFEEIEILRNELYHDHTILNVADFGAGSLKSNFKQRKVSDIAKTAGRNQKFGKLLFRIMNQYGIKQAIELGTSLGLGTSYLAKANPDANIQTIEGSHEISQRAEQSFLSLGINSVHQHVGNFDDVLIEILETSKPIDLIIIDGNHRKEPTIDYFKKSLPFIHENSIIIFDDIHWSPGMQEAWETIKSTSEVTLSIDLFFFGIVFFKKDFKEKQDFILKY